MYLAGKGAAQTWPVMWLDSSGKMQPLIATPGFYGVPRFSPDGRRLALAISTSSGTDIYVYELERETMTRLTFGGHARTPVWTPDGKHIAFQSVCRRFRDLVGPQRRLRRTTADPRGSRQHNSVVLLSRRPAPGVLRINPETGSDIWTLTLDTSDPDHPKPGKPEPFLATPSD